MESGAAANGVGTAFDRVAAQYDRHRPTYPDALVDRACAIAGLQRDDRVLEIGCGTGQLTGALVERGLRVTALEPGRRLRELARRNLRGAPGLELVGAALEQATLAPEHFSAAFAASSFHWPDPDVSWRRVFDALQPDGTFALIQYFGLQDERSADDQQQLLDAIARVAPELAEGWPSYRDLGATVAGVRERRANVSEVWGWLGGHDLAREYAAELFADVRLEVVPALVQHTADELSALLETMSFWARLEPEQRAALTGESRALHERLGRPIRSSTVAVLVTARRRR